MIKKLFKVSKSDSGDSLVSAVFVIPVILLMIVTGLDFSLYMANRAQIQGIARDGARTVAIMGGDGTATTGTPLEKKYGKTREEACGAIKAGSPAAAALNAKSTPIECNVMDALNNANGMVNVQINSVTCSPEKANAIGTRVTCEVKWKYGGIPGSGLTMIRNGAIMNSNPSLAGQSVTAGSAESEVNLSDINLEPRGTNGRA